MHEGGVSSALMKNHFNGGIENTLVKDTDNTKSAKLRISSRMTGENLKRDDNIIAKDRKQTLSTKDQNMIINF